MAAVWAAVLLSLIALPMPVTMAGMTVHTNRMTRANQPQRSILLFLRP